MSGSLLRNNGPFYDSEYTRRGKQLLFDPASKHLMLPPASQDVPLERLGQDYFYKSLGASAGSYSDRQDAVDAWNAGQAAAGARMQSAFDGAVWAQAQRPGSSSDEATSRNQVYAYSGNVIAQQMRIWALFARIPSSATGLPRMTSVSLRARPYQSYLAMGDPSGAAFTFAVGVSATDSPLATASGILSLPSASLDMSRDTEYQDVTIPCDYDVSGDKWLFLYEFPADFNPLKLRMRYPYSGSVCRADIYHTRSGHFTHHGFRVVVHLEGPAP